MTVLVRTCSGCGKNLSRYNDDPRCWQCKHADREPSATEQALVDEYLAHERRIEADDRDAEVRRRDQARIAFEAVSSGLTQQEFGERIGRSQKHVSILTLVWRHLQSHPDDDRPFARLYRAVQLGGASDLDTKAADRAYDQRRLRLRRLERVVAIYEGVEHADLSESERERWTAVLELAGRLHVGPQDGSDTPPALGLDPNEVAP